MQLQATNFEIETFNGKQIKYLGTRPASCGKDTIRGKFLADFSEKDAKDLICRQINESIRNLGIFRRIKGADKNLFDSVVNELNVADKLREWYE